MISRERIGESLCFLGFHKLGEPFLGRWFDYHWVCPKRRCERCGKVWAFPLENH